MYNTRKICLQCGYKITYDSDRDIHNFKSYVYCPKCKTVLSVNPYCPNF